MSPRAQTAFIDKINSGILKITLNCAFPPAWVPPVAEPVLLQGLWKHKFPLLRLTLKPDTIDCSCHASCRQAGLRGTGLVHYPSTRAGDLIRLSYFASIKWFKNSFLKKAMSNGVSFKNQLLRQAGCESMDIWYNSSFRMKTGPLGLCSASGLGTGEILSLSASY